MTSSKFDDVLSDADLPAFGLKALIVKNPLKTSDSDAEHVVSWDDAVQGDDTEFNVIIPAGQPGLDYIYIRFNGCSKRCNAHSCKYRGKYRINMFVS